MPLNRRNFLTRLAAILPLAASLPSTLLAASPVKRKTIAVLDIEGPNGPIGYCDIEISKLIIGTNRPVDRQRVVNLTALFWGMGTRQVIPIVVTPIQGTGCYQVQDGLHRVLAFKDLGQTTIPCIIMLEWAHDWQMIANSRRYRSEDRVHRKGLNFAESYGGRFS